MKKPCWCMQGFVFGSSTWARTRDLRINSPSGWDYTGLSETTCHS